MNLSENFESVKNFAIGAAQTATQKAKVLAAVAKANVSIYAEEDKIRKAEAQLGKLYYRDYAVGEEMDTAEYLPWCQKIDESKKLIAELKDYIDDVKAADEAPAASHFIRHRCNHGPDTGLPRRELPARPTLRTRSPRQRMRLLRKRPAAAKRRRKRKPLPPRPPKLKSRS